MLTQQWQVSLTQLNSSSLQQIVQYLLYPHKVLGMSLGPMMGMIPSPTRNLLWHRLGMYLGMQEIKQAYNVMAFCQQVGSLYHLPPPPHPLQAPPCLFAASRPSPTPNPLPSLLPCSQCQEQFEAAPLRTTSDACPHSFAKACNLITNRSA